MKREPLITTALITSLVGAVLTLLVAFGVPLTEAQQDAINGLVIVAAPLVVALVGRRYVTPLSDPRDVDGEPLTRADNSLALRARGGKINLSSGNERWRV
jgi:hypothetical protein